MTITQTPLFEVPFEISTPGPIASSADNRLGLTTETEKAPMALLDDLIAGITDPATRAAISREIKTLKDQKTFGLVFERHAPENVQLPSHPIRRGLTVRYRSDSPDAPVWTVTKAKANLADLTRNDADGNPVEAQGVPFNDLVVVRRIGDPIYPGLKPVGSVQRGGNKPTHVVINAENHHALETLLYTHAGKVDVIYIDPPYNTGAGDWIYNDKYIDSVDSFGHSKWLSFMERRLRMAKLLLKQTGVVIVAIDDNEQHRLRMLMDEVFGESNFLNTLIWQGGYDARSRFVSRGHDYMHIFAANIDALSNAGVKWTEAKPGMEDLVAAANVIWNECEHNSDLATKRLRSWIKLNGAHLAAGLQMYSNMDDMGRLFRGGDLSCPASGTPYWYDILHPVTGLPVKKPSGGWRHSPERLAQNLTEGRILFGGDEKTTPRYKRFITDSESQVPRTVFEADRARSRKHLQGLLGEDRFPYPKDVAVLQRWIGMIVPKDGIVLDFFAGSGSTGEAVIRLNAEDSGSRQSIIVTSNELAAHDAKSLTKDGFRDGDAEWEARGVFEYVTKPRLETVVTGIRPDGSKYSDGLSENVAFFELTYEDRPFVEMGRSFSTLSPILWMKASATGPMIAERDLDKGWALPEGSSYGVLFDTAKTNEFAEAISGSETVSHVFVETDSTAIFQQVVSLIPAHICTERLYDSYVASFETVAAESQ